MAMSETLGWVTPFIAVWATIWAFLQQILPDKSRTRVFDALSPYAYYEVFEIDGFVDNELYKYVNIYLSTLTAYRAHRSHLLLPKNGREMQFTLSTGQHVHDTFAGVTLRWEHKVTERKNTVWKLEGESSESRHFELRLRRKFKGKFLEAYVSSIVQKSKALDKTNRELRLHSNRKNKNDMPYSRVGGAWHHIPFRHPATFDSIALEKELKDTIVNDLEDFADGKDFYRGVGKAWKRGYLLYGPPGTGKTSIVAAMANKLQYDIYDLELTEVKSNSQLRELLTYTDSKSIIVIEDIDCSLDLSGQRKKKSKKENTAATNPSFPGAPSPEDDTGSEVTLSGLLNFTDGLWSACEGERIFVFTTNYVNKLDPALVRSGRMDMHIHLSYCTFNSFKSLASSFFKIDWHDAYEKLEELFEEGAKIVPSEAAEIMMRNRRNPDAAMGKVEELLRERVANPPPPEPKPEDCGKVEEEEEEDEALKGRSSTDGRKAEEDPEANLAQKKEERNILGEKSTDGEQVQESVQESKTRKKND